MTEELVESKSDEKILRDILPDAYVTKWYSFKIVEFLPDIPEEFDISIHSSDGETGLTFNPENDSVQGFPLISGEFILELKVQPKNQTVEHNSYPTYKFSITINPDPKSLWKSLPSDKSDPYWKDDYSSDIIVAEKYIIASSIRGRSHAQDGKFRDDAFRIKYLPEGWYLVAVADGSGSAKYSRKGSEIACEKSIMMLTEKIRDTKWGEYYESFREYSEHKIGKGGKTRNITDLVYNIMGGSAFDAKKAITDEVARKRESGDPNITSKDFATTLILAALKKFDFGWLIMSYWVGDGGIGIYKMKEDVKILGEADSGEFAGQTRFLTMSEVWEPYEIQKRTNFEVIDDFTAIALMTDGVTDPKFETENNLKKLVRWDELWNDITQTVSFHKSNNNPHSQLLTWLEFWSRGNHDDRTIAIIY